MAEHSETITKERHRMAGLNVSDVVRVDINLSPIAAPLRNFGALCIAGSSSAIDPNERIREYTTLDGVAADFGSAAPEFLAADLFFSQRPTPSILYIGRFSPNGSNAVLHGAIFSPVQAYNLLQRLRVLQDATLKIDIDGIPRQVSASAGYLRSAPFATQGATTLHTALLTTIDGGFIITIDNVVVNLPPINFQLINPTDVQVGLADAADLISEGLGAAGTCEWDEPGSTFVIRSASTGSISTVSYASAPMSGTDLSEEMRLTAASGAAPPSVGTLGMNFTGAVTMNGVAKIMSDAIDGGRAWWDGTRFHIESLTQGPTSAIGYAYAAGIGTDVSGVLGLTQASGASVPVAGVKAETPLECALALRAHAVWYGLTFATTAPLSTADHLAVASYLEGANPISIYGYTTADPLTLDATSEFDLASLMKAQNLERTFGQYSTSSPYAVCSALGKAFTVDFEASNTTITLKFKQEPGVVAEQLTETQASTLKFKHCNVFVYYSNDTAILQEGVMANGFFFDEVHGTDWLANRIQTDVYNVLYTAPTKIPQTNQGVHILVTTVENALIQGVVNGLIAPGQWNAPGFGSIAFGQMLSKGYYVYAPLVESQPQSIREQRIAPTIQCAIKLAGAIHRSFVIVNVNR
jgi:hypothetical protein